MRWQYRIHFAGGASSISIRTEEVFDCLAYFRKRFGSYTIVQVEGRFGSGAWTASELLPTCQEERDAIDAGPNHTEDFDELTAEERLELEDWLDGNT